MDILVWIAIKDEQTNKLFSVRMKLWDLTAKYILLKIVVSIYQ